MTKIEISFVPYQNGNWELIIKSPFGDVTLNDETAPSAEDLEILSKLAPPCVYTTYQTDEVTWP